MTTKYEPIKYFAAKMFGSRTGAYNENIAQTLWEEDIERAKKDIKVVVTSPDGLDAKIESLLEAKLEENPEFQVRIVTGPFYDASHDLYKRGRVSLIQIDQDPEVECRIIDSRSTILIGKGKYSQTFDNITALRDRREYFFGLWKRAESNLS